MKAKTVQTTAVQATDRDTSEEYVPVSRPWFISVLWAIGLILAYIVLAFCWVWMKTGEAMYSVFWEATQRIKEAWEDSQVEEKPGLCRWNLEDVIEAETAAIARHLQKRKAAIEGRISTKKEE